MYFGGIMNIQQASVVAPGSSSTDQPNICQTSERAPSDTLAHSQVPCTPDTNAQSQVTSVVDLDRFAVKSNQTPVAGVSLGIRKIQKRRNVTGADALVCLTSSYGKHLNTFCKNRKHAVQQRIPAAVWKEVYKDFVEERKKKFATDGIAFDKNALPQERTLQNALRCALEDIQTSTSDTAGAHRLTVQDNDLMRKLKESDTYNKKKMCNFRETLLSDSTKTSDATPDLNEDVLAQSACNCKELPVLQTKKKILENTVKAISSMVTVVENQSANLCQAVMDQTKVQENDIAESAMSFSCRSDRKNLRQKQVEALNSEEIDRKINRLIVLCDQKVISDAEFKERIKGFVDV